MWKYFEYFPVIYQQELLAFVYSLTNNQDSMVKYDWIAGLFGMQPFFCINQQRYQKLSANFMVLIYFIINIFQSFNILK